MTRKLYVIRDLLGLTESPPFFCVSDKHAIRQLTLYLTDPQTRINPADVALVQLADYPVDAGQDWGSLRLFDDYPRVVVTGNDAL